MYSQWQCLHRGQLVVLARTISRSEVLLVVSVDGTGVMFREREAEGIVKAIQDVTLSSSRRQISHVIVDDK